VREKIERSERDARWEFPKQLLFARTNYMAEICNDLIEMVEIVDDFFMFLGPELKAVTGACSMRQHTHTCICTCYANAHTHTHVFIALALQIRECERYGPMPTVHAACDESTRAHTCT